ncbi:bifunctional metallophosphatase/5'-nucleotidase [Janibacter melonis]|uniref:bifunctional metallophosphatase/5'-nucleotidase n=1 Tax=Janibacter melonis TaxID=262209 RepID=UPI00174DDB6E|nr:5'-nucleotidase C-terminal domain-containing protein [Janibacter melonis]
MKHTKRLAVGLPATLALALAAGLPAAATPSAAPAAPAAPAAAAPAADTTAAAPSAWGDRWRYVNIFSFSDFHGHLEANDPALAPEVDPTQTPVGGVAHLAANIKARKGSNGITVSAGDNIGGSTFLSGLFHDEPTIEVLDEMDVKASAVGNHEFDEGTNELLRIQHGGAHPKDGTYFPGKPYPGADMEYLASNVTNTKNGRKILPGTSVQTVNGVKVGFIGVVTPETPSLVSPGGVSSIRFDEIAAKVNSAASWLSSTKDVETIVVLMHEGGSQDGTIDQCENLSGPVVELNRRINSRVDGIVTGHTHSSFNCTLTDWKGGQRPVVASGDWGRAFNQMRLLVDLKTGDVVKKSSRATNHLNVRSTTADPGVQAILDKWIDRAGPERAKVVGTVAEDITGDASGNRGIETPMADLVADSILWGTQAPERGGAQIAMMNVGGVRSSFARSTITNGEQVGEITYEEAYKVAPFGNLLVTVDMTGAQIKAVLEQQYVPTRGRKYLALGVSEGFSYTWDDTQAEGSKVSGMELDGTAIDPAKTYRVATLSFLAEGGDDFTAFEDSTNLTGGPEDLENLVRYLQANPGLTAPEDRVAGL